MGQLSSFQVWGLETILPSPRVAKPYMGKGISIMKSKPVTTRKMARQAFGLLLELRQREDAHEVLSKALAFLEILVREKQIDASTIVLSIRLMPLRKSSR